MPHNFTISNEAEWHHFRGHYVGGSEVAALFDQWLVDGRVITTHLYEPVPDNAMFIGGLSPFKTGHRLWVEKAGIAPPEDFAYNDRVQAGRHLEAGIAAWAMERWPDFRLRKVRRYLTHDKVAGWGATLDYETVAAPRVPVEIKNVAGIQFAQKWDAEGDTIITAPLSYLLQVQSQIGVSGAPYGWLVACVNGNALYRMRVDRHEPTQERMQAAIEAFWAGVHGRIFVRERMDRATVVLTADVDDGDSVADLSADEKLALWIRQYERWLAHQKRVEAHVDNLKGRIVGSMGDATVALTAARTLKWPRIVREERIVPERVEPRREYRGALYVSALKAKKTRKEPVDA